MQASNSEMPTSRSEPSLSAPSSPSLSAPSSPVRNPASSSEQPTPTLALPPAPPTPPPLPTALLPQPPELDEVSDEPVLPSFLGTLEAFLRSAQRQSKWALVLILPRRPSRSSPSSPAARPARPAWGPSAYHAPQKLTATRKIADNFMLWRRTSNTQESERYSNFYPVDGSPHIALLDPRSGERLAVWGNIDGESMVSHNAISDLLWQLVVADLEEFLKEHSLEDGVLGPAHHREKPWAVRTRRFMPSPVAAPLPSTAIMDDEDAAIAAAIAASLAESRSSEPEIDEQPSSSDDGYPEDDDDDMSSSDSLTQEDSSKASDESPDSSQTEEINHDDMDISSGPTPFARVMSLPVTIPSRGRDPTPSSVESLSSSYIERMESCLRSSTDPALLEARRLRQEQDEELARSLEADRRRIRQENHETARRSAQKAQQLAADARLPDEPAEDSSGALTIALRLPGGVRIARRFNSFDKLASVADFAVARIGCVEIIEKGPGTVLKIPGAAISASTWDVKLSELGLSSRTMFILNFV